MHGEVKWYDQPKELHGFLAAMVDVGALDSGSSVTEVLEKPWHWDDEYAIWVQLGKPCDSSESGWRDFDAAIAELSISAT